ncbi:MAG TPA: hypothetical protein VEU33_44480, partial [Archangium sp.]|nr:hypothetical protein [Archangium sp.]
MSQEPQEFPPAAGGASELRAEGRLLRNADPVRGEYIAPDGRITSAWWTQPTCYLAGSALVVAAGQPYWFKVTGSNLPSTARGYWFGTKNGVTDTSSVLAGAVPATFYSTNQPGSQGVYTRWMEIRDGNNRV